MKMYNNLILLVFFSLLISINGQQDDERDFPPAAYQAGRNSKASFDTLFSRGRCPERFLQVGDECLFFSTDGKIYTWHQAERVCSQRIARMLEAQSASNVGQPNMNPVKGVRQLVLNTPEKTEILRALFREYNEQNFAVRLPYDYNTLQRCRDGKDDKWPHYCSNTPTSNSTCFETVTHGANDICLRGVDCRQSYLRLACEFTLPGSPELENSRFRQCSKRRTVFQRVPRWAWITIGVGSGVILLVILGVIFGCLGKSKKNSSGTKKSMPEPRHIEEKVYRISSKRDDAAAEPMLTRASPVDDTGYLQPRITTTDNSANA